MRGHRELYRPKRRSRDDRETLEERLRAAESVATRALVLSHGHCLDGVGSVVVALRALGTDGVGVAYLQPGHMARALDLLVRFPGRGRRLLIADLSVNPDQFDEVVDACVRLDEQDWIIEWRDHHHKQWESLDLGRLTKHVVVLEVNEDATESGASLMQKALAPTDRFARRFADTVKDRDLWWNKTPDSETLEFAITWLGEEVFVEHFLARKARDPVVDDFIRQAAARQKALIEKHTQVLLRGRRLFETPHGDRVGVVYGYLPKNVGLHRLLEEDGVQIAINVRPNGKISFRSRPGVGITHRIARRFDGGGHPNASGGDLGLRGLAYWWYIVRRGRVARVAQVAKAAVEELTAWREERDAA